MNQSENRGLMTALRAAMMLSHSAFAHLIPQDRIVPVEKGAPRNWHRGTGRMQRPRHSWVDRRRGYSGRDVLDMAAALQKRERKWARNLWLVERGGLIAY